MSESQTGAGVPEVLLQTTRGLLWVRSEADVRELAAILVIALGGRLVPAAARDSEALPLDVSFGVGHPMLARADHGTAARHLLEEHLPGFMEDAWHALERASQVERLAEDASIDTLTSVPNRRRLGRGIGRVRAGDVVIMLDLDHFKAVNDTFGHSAGDRVLRSLGRVLQAEVRGRDDVGRYGGEEFVVLLYGGGDADAFLGRIRRVWEKARPLVVTFSAGVAEAGDMPLTAVEAAAGALQKAKHAGRDRWVWADGRSSAGAPR